MSKQNNTPQTSPDMFTPTNTPELPQDVHADRVAELLTLDYSNPVAWVISASRITWLRNDLSAQTEAQDWAWGHGCDWPELDAWHAANVEDIYGLADVWNQQAQQFEQNVQQLTELERMASRASNTLTTISTLLTKAMRERFRWPFDNMNKAANLANALSKDLRNNGNFPSEAQRDELRQAFSCLTKPSDLGHGLPYDRRHGLESIHDSAWDWKRQKEALQIIDQLHTVTSDMDRRAAIMDEVAQHLREARQGSTRQSPERVWLDQLTDCVQHAAEAARGNEWATDRQATSWGKTASDCIEGLKMLAQFAEARGLAKDWEPGFLNALAAIAVAEAEVPAAVVLDLETAEA